MEPELSIYKLTKTMSMTELESYCKGQPELKIIYSDENQNQSTACPLFLRMTFDEIMISLNPNAVHLKNGNGSLTLNGVEKIEFYTGGVGDIIVLSCRCNIALSKYNRCNFTISKYKLIFD